MSGRSRLLYIHASQDEDLRKALEMHLTSLAHEGIIEGWHAGLLSPGADVEEELAAEVALAEVVLLLLSADFMASSSCQALLEQVQRACAERHIQVVPVLARPVDWHGSGANHLRPLPQNGVAVTMWPNQDAAWLNVAQALRSMLSGTTGVADSSVNVPFSPPRSTEMPTSPGVASSRSISIGGNVTGSAIVAGDRNTINVRHQQVNRRPPASIDLRAELAAIHRILLELQSEEHSRIKRAMEEAQEEAEKPVPRKEVVGESIEKALVLARQASTFVDTVARVRPHVVNVTAWLGATWHNLLPIVGSIL